MDQPKVKEEPKEWQGEVENVNTYGTMFCMQNIQVKQESLGNLHDGTCENLCDANLDFFKEELQDKRCKSGILSEKLVITLNPVSNLCYKQQPGNEEQHIQSEYLNCHSDDYSMRHIKVESTVNKVTSSKCTQSLGSSADTLNLANNIKLEDKTDEITPISLEETHKNYKTTNNSTDNNVEVKIEVKEELTNEAQPISTPKKKKCYRDLNYENTASSSKSVNHITNINQITEDQDRLLKKKSKVNRDVISKVNNDELNLLEERCVKYENVSLESNSLLLEVKFENIVKRRQGTTDKLDQNSLNCDTVASVKETTDKQAQKNNLHCDKVCKPFACTLCSYSTNLKSSLIYHTRTHTGEKPFSCKYCDYKCNRKSNLVIHTRTHTGEKPYACHLCNFKCILKTRLVPHMRIHTGERPFTCKLCNFKSTRKINLDNHIRIHTGEKPYVCKLCDFKCNQKSGLLSHMSTHTNEKPYSCKLCDYKCSKNSNLVSHNRTHTDERLFMCDICNKRFRDKCTLQKHARIHTGERPYACQHCNFRFGRKEHLDNHAKIHTGEKPFACDHCSYTCRIKNRLIPHIMNHTGDKPFKCKLCNYKGSRKTNLVYHMRTHAKKEPISDISSTNVVKSCDDLAVRPCESLETIMGSNPGRHQ